MCEAAVVLRLSAVLLAAACASGGGSVRGEGGEWTFARADTASVVRVNQVGYLPAGRKVAVVCSTTPRRFASFFVLDAERRVVLGPAAADSAGAFGPCRATHRLDFSALTEPGTYRLLALPRGAADRALVLAARSGAVVPGAIDTLTGVVLSPPIHIAADAYRGAADTLLHFLRQQRSLFNPAFRDSVHAHTDGILVDAGERTGEFIQVAGGWADAADYLQYVTTSATTTFSLLLAYRDHPRAFGDAFGADGLPGGNGVADVLDEARWGLEWLLRMFPEDDLVLNQIADDRDHSFLDLPTTDSSDYGWGRGGFRPVYPCTGRPQGLFETRNRSTGKASTAGKLASAFALGAQLFVDSDSAFSARLRERAVAAYDTGRASPGVCQTAPARSPYFYEEANWVDDMELAAAELYAVTKDPDYLRAGLDYAAREPVTPWMGRDTARHYEWYPFHNNGHYEVWRSGEGAARRLMIEDYRRGLAAVAERADNGFLAGIPFIWCSNDLMASFATQALLYRNMSGDTTFARYETAALDWLLGTNPWGVSMVIGLPADGRFPRDPHSVVAKQLGREMLRGGLVDGPVYRSIFENLRGIQLTRDDELARWNTGFIVYHDDWGDYSTNEPILDGTANLVYVLAAREEDQG